MKIVWLPVALKDLAHIKNHHTEQASVTVAANQLARIVKSASLLATQPHMEHPSPNVQDHDILEWDIPSTSYTLPYHIAGDEIRILRVFDQRRKRPDSWH